MPRDCLISKTTKDNKLAAKSGKIIKQVCTLNNFHIAIQIKTSFLGFLNISD